MAEETIDRGPADVTLTKGAGRPSRGDTRRGEEANAGRSQASRTHCEPARPAILWNST